MELERREVPSATIVDLGTLAGNIGTDAKAINNRGQVVGDSNAADGQRHAVLYSDGVLRDLGTLPGEPDSVAFSINEVGEVVGTSGGAAFLAEGGVLLRLPNLGAPPSFALGINDEGQVVGNSGVPGGPSHAFVISGGGTIRDLGTLPGDVSSSAGGINNRGQVVGTSSGLNFADHAFLDSGGVLMPLGNLPGRTTSQATAINEAGQVVGSSGDAGNVNSHAFLYSNGTMTDLGAPPGLSTSFANAINNEGEVVGFAISADSQVVHAFLYRDGATIDLNSLLPSGSGWTLERANGINDAGQIVGSGLHNGLPRAFLLNPEGFNAAPTVLAVQRLGVLAAPTRLVVTFSTPIDPARAVDPANYRLVAPGRDGRLGTSDDLRVGLTATYDPAIRAATLAPGRRLNAHRPYRLTVIGSPPNGIADPAGVPLDGNADGISGGNYVAIVRGFVGRPVPGHGAPRPAAIGRPRRG